MEQKQYLSDEEARAAIIEVGKRIYQKGYVAANDGNISCRISENEILVTPTGVSKGYMTPESMVRMNLDGEVLSEGKPSSEVKMHIRAYRENPEINAVVHAHPIVSTSFSIVGLEMAQPVVSEAVLVTGNILFAPYAEPGSYEVPEAIAPYVKDYNAVLLANHGALSWGRDLYQALYRMEALEHQAQIYFHSLLLAHITGKDVNYLSKEANENLVKIRERMGVTTGGFPKTDR